MSLTGRSPWRPAASFLRRAFEAAQEAGDLTYAAYSCIDLITNLLAAGDPLGDVQREAEDALEFVRKVRFGLIVDIITAQLRLIRTLRGLTPDFGSFNDAEFDEDRFEQHLESNPRLAIAACSVLDPQAAGLRLTPATTHLPSRRPRRRRRLLWTVPTHDRAAGVPFLRARWPGRRAATRHRPRSGPRHLEALAAHHRQIAIWAENCPENFANRAALAGRRDGAPGRPRAGCHAPLRSRPSARRASMASSRTRRLANELAARFYAARGFETIAHAYLRKARSCYLRWGADGKVRQLDGCTRICAQEPPAPPPTAVWRPRRAAGPGDRGQGLAGGLRRDRPAAS